MKIEDIFGDLPQLQTPRLILRKMEIDDAQDMFEYASDPEVSKFTLWEPHRSIEDSKTFLECVNKSYENKLIENWGIVYKENNKFIGTCGYFKWYTDHALAEIQYALSRQYWNKGIMTEAVREVLRFGFTKMGLNRIEAKCVTANTGSERIMQKAGMKFEGIMRECVHAKGAFYDCKSYAILKKDWQQNVAAWL